VARDDEVRGGQCEAAVLNGIYVQIGTFKDRPHYAKDGIPFDQPRYGFRENLQIWWHDGEWRIGNTGDHWLRPALTRACEGDFGARVLDTFP
jgi:hypothetical protein